MTHHVPETPETPETPEAPEAPEALTGDYLDAWATAALDGLHRHRAEINRLNVFPIPDSDTGTNMAATMESAVIRLRTLQAGNGGRSAVDVAAALAAGAVAGARGNSGMVLSQILRAVADTAALSATGDLSARAVPVMLARAGELVLQALSNPVEGTIVTVLHAAAEGAREAGPGGHASLSEVVTAARDAAAVALAQTTGQLAALSDAGVVDAGGRGLVVILQALVDALHAGPDSAPAPASPRDGTVDDDAGRSHGNGADPHLELVFGFRGDTGELRALLDRFGDSVVVVSDGVGDHTGNHAHVHTTRAGELIERVFALGEVHDLRIEVLPVVVEPVRTPPASPVIALVPAGEGLAALFRSAGAAVGDSPASLTAAVDAVDGPVIVLTNGQDTTGLFAVLDDTGTAVTVVDTGSVVGGLAALAVYSPTADLEDNAEDMADAVHGQRWADVTGDDLLTDVVGDLLADGGELVTVLYGDELGAGGMAEVEARIAASHPDAEFHAVHVPGLPVTAQVGVE
ncbi:DAK2 domain-containing protein [uncultured Corynebacterium sp.]|uniref:DAK2 domain-containing protein n=1 Tax=uncultured Corynebacterium sp. TaxID=159447 RepID=UPI0025CFE98B|nr:DAK2 domain-containing protein [uncultured Corynebacterium sp.]